MEGVRSVSPEIQDCYLKNFFPSMLSITSLDFISDIGVSVTGTMIDNIENTESSSPGMLYKHSLETYMKKRQ